MDRINALPEGGMLPGMESRATRVNNADLEASGRSGVHDDNLQAEESAISPPAQMVEMLQVPMGSTPVSESSVGLTLMAFPHTTFMFVVNNMILKKLIGFETRCRVPRALYDTAAATMDGILLTTLDTNLELVMQGKTTRRQEMRALILLSGLPDFFVTPNPYDVNSPIVAIMSGLSRDLVMDMDGKFAHAHERRVGHYGIVEAQGRGTLHIHVLGKSPNVPPQAVIARNIQLLGQPCLGPTLIAEPQTNNSATLEQFDLWRVIKRVESALDAIKRSGADVEQLFMLVHGEAGTGRSRVINSNCDMFVVKGRNSWLNICAPTGVAAAPIGSSTIHATCGIGTAVSAAKPMSNLAKAELEASYRKVQAVPIDENSMVGAELFVAMYLHFDALYPSCDHRTFGGLHVLAFGDFFHFEPIMARSLTVSFEQVVKTDP
ncbi:hypothetical protein H9P43_007673 [Blastocladiella emersonii ATCC 22665]|nr:hypothetical protein H9P43_007673 [Blastocladiella emersonii ATCC 22665]